MSAVACRRGPDKEARGRPVLAGLLRVLGSSMAELPLVATRLDCRRQGHLRALVEGLKHKLIELGVRALVLPATNDAVSVAPYRLIIIRRVHWAHSSCLDSAPASHSM